jgi:hypothetical protein
VPAYFPVRTIGRCGSGKAKARMIVYKRDPVEHGMLQPP